MPPVRYYIQCAIVKYWCTYNISRYINIKKNKKKGSFTTVNRPRVDYLYFTT